MKELIPNLIQAETYREYCKLSNLIEKTDSSEKEQLKIAFLRSFTIEPLIPVIRTKIAQMGFAPSFYIGEYDNMAQEVFNTEGDFYKFSPDFIVMFQWPEQIAPNFVKRFLSFKTSQDVEDEINRIVDQFDDYISGIRQKSASTIILNNFPVLERGTLGILDSQNENFYYSSIQKINQRLLQLREKHSGVYILDLDRLFSFHGLQASYDKRSWQMAQAPLGRDVLIPLAFEVCSYFSSLRGLVKKCLVLDCDNTLWGGIIGEDGIGGIKLGADYPGSCYLDFHKEVLNLHDRGVMIALCSKNNKEDVLEVLRNHDFCLIKEEHLSSYRVNWGDKASNIEYLAKELNIGLDSFVFVDDSDFECNLIKERLPMVEVMQVPKQSYKLAGMVTESRLFDSLAYSNEDRKKNAMYRSNKEREKILSESKGIEDYLRKLEQRAELAIPREGEISRISQLTQKTNQFNLTTKRYSEADIKKFLKSDKSEVFRLKLSDNTSELGIIATAIITFNEKTANIDSFLMSCRALGRGIEKTILVHILEECKKRGIETVTAQYRKTAKNNQVKDFYLSHGFDCTESSEEERKYIFNLNSDIPFTPDWIDLTIL